MAYFSALNRLILVFLSFPEVSRNRHKPKINYMPADGHTEKAWQASRIFDLIY